jgi:hypothetical protein
MIQKTLDDTHRHPEDRHGAECCLESLQIARSLSFVWQRKERRKTSGSIITAPPGEREKTSTSKRPRCKEGEMSW